MPDDTTLIEAIATLASGRFTYDPPTEDDPAAALVITSEHGWLELMVTDSRVYGRFHYSGGSDPLCWRIEGRAERER